MGSQLATKMVYNKDTRTIEIYSASSNVRPLHYNWGGYPPSHEELFFYDLIARTVQFNQHNIISDKINHIIDKINEMHKDKYPLCDEENGIGAYSLYKMLKTHNAQPPTTEGDYSMFIESYQKECRDMDNLYKEHWYEFQLHVDTLYQYFKANILN